MTTINDIILPGPGVPQIEFLYGILQRDATDSTFTDTTVVFSSTTVAVVNNLDIVDVVGDNGTRCRGIVQGVNAGTKTLTIDVWKSVDGSLTATQPLDGSRVLVRRPGAPFQYHIGATVYTPNDTYIYTTTDILTFVSLVVIPPRLPSAIAMNIWDFGDGITAYGPKVIHQYTMNSRDIRAVLQVQDNLGKVRTSGQQIYTVVSETIAGDMIFV